MTQVRRLVNFNINDFVQVRLTYRGREILKQQHRELRGYFPGLGEYLPPLEDADGYSRWQLWDLMSRLGDHCDHGLSPPFDTVIRVEIEP